MERSAATPPRAVLFDMDDTIFDHSLTCRAAIRRVRRETPFLQRRPLRALWNDYLTLLNAPSANRRSVTSRQMRLKRWRRIAVSCGVDLAPAQVREISERYRAHYLELRRAIPGAVELVRDLHRSRHVAIVTNNEVAEQEEKLDFLGVRSAVDALVISQAVGTSKPDPRIFREALRRLDVRPSSAVMIGDSWTNDVLGAAGAGIRAVWFNRFGLPRPDRTPVTELRRYEPVARAAKTVLAGPRRAPAPRPRARS